MLIDQSPAPVVQEVIVRGARLPPAAGDPAFSIIRLDRADLERQPRLDEALKQTPGVSLFRRTSSAGANPTTQGLSLRSVAPSGAGRALVLLDGVPQNDPFGGWVIWTGLPSEGLASAAIVRGAGAGAYGAGALTGTVSLSSLDARDAPLRADAFVGELESRRAALAVGGPVTSRVGALGVFAAESTGGWIPVRERRGAADAPLELDAVSGSVKLETEVGGAAAAARLAAFTEDREAGLVGAGSRAQGVQGSLTLAKVPEPGRFGWRLQAWATGSDLQNRSAAVAAGRTGTTPANDQYETPAWGAGANAALRRSGEAGEWEVGADLRVTDGEVRERFRVMAGSFTRVRAAGGRTVTAGAYVDGTRRSGPWLMTAGARADVWEASDARRIERDTATGALTLDARPEGRREVVPTARAGLRRELADGWFTRAAAYAGFRPPTLNELHRPFRVGNDITEANAALKPERLYGAELGAGRDAGPFSLGLTAFVNRLDDPVANVTIGFGPGTFPIAGFVPASGVLRQRRNVGRIEAVGLEAEAEARLTERLTLRAAAGWTDAEVDGGAEAPQLTGLRPAQAPRTTATASVDWLATERLSVSAAARYESARFDDDLNSRRLGAATAVDGEVRYELTANARAYLGVENLFDADIQTGRTGDDVLSYDQPRTLRVGLTFAR
jgi:outer membrane receptor protein involved in Fe transport